MTYFSNRIGLHDVDFRIYIASVEVMFKHSY